MRARVLNRRRGLLAVMSAALALGCIAGIAEATAPPGFVGMVSEDTFAGRPSYQSAQLTAMRAAGVTLLRQTFDWSVIERRRGVYNFSLYDPLVAAAARHGIQIMPDLFNPPSFLSGRPRGSHLRGTYPPRSNNSLAAFARAAVRRYGPNGIFWATHRSVPALPIRIWQVWNEPNLPVFWLPKPSASQYAAMLAAAGHAIHAVDPSAEVVSAGIPQSKLGVELFTYLRALLAAGAAKSMDTLGVNAYSHTASGMIALLKQVRSTLNAGGAANIAIRVTEFGWSDGGPGSSFTLTPTGQATQIAAAIRGFALERSALDLRGFVYYAWRDAKPYPGIGDFWGLHTGLLHLDGKPKPALESFSAASKSL
jgi:polysaccharide biosynthesis protein PslG